MSASGGLEQVWQSFMVQSLWDLGVSSGFSRTAALQGLPQEDFTLKRIPLAPSQNIFFSLCTLVIPASTMLNLLTQTDVEGASIIIPLEML